MSDDMEISFAATDMDISPIETTKHRGRGHEDANGTERRPNMIVVSAQNPNQSLGTATSVAVTNLAAAPVTAESRFAAARARFAAARAQAAARAKIADNPVDQPHVIAAIPSTDASDAWRSTDSNRGRPIEVVKQQLPIQVVKQQQEDGHRPPTKRTGWLRQPNSPTSAGPTTAPTDTKQRPQLSDHQPHPWPQLPISVADAPTTSVATTPTTSLAAVAAASDGIHLEIIFPADTNDRQQVSDHKRRPTQLPITTPWQQPATGHRPPVPPATKLPPAIPATGHPPLGGHRPPATKWPPAIPATGRPPLGGHRPPDTGNHEPGTRAPATYNRQRSVYVNKGTYGCVLRPSEPCPDIQWNHNTVSKVFHTKKHAFDEKQIHDTFVAMADKNSEFTVELVSTCDIDPSKVDAQCGQEYVRKQPLYQLVYIDGGQDLSKAARTVKFDTLFERFEAIFKGLCTMNTLKYMHMDIKPDNMVYNSSTRKLALIDFGLARGFTDYKNQLYSQFANMIFPHPYAYYPGEFPLLGNIINQKAPSKRNANIEHLNAIVTKLVAALDTHNPQSSALRLTVIDLRTAINTTIDMSEYYTDVTKYIPDKIDVYGFGASIINILRMSVESKQTSIDSMEDFYVDVVKLCTKMVAASPRDRFSAQDAKTEYDRIQKDISN